MGTVSWMMTTSNTSQHFSPNEFDAFGIVQTAAVQRAACNLLPQGLKTAFVNKILLWKITDALLLSSKPSTTTLTKEEVRLTCSSALCYYWVFSSWDGEYLVMWIQTCVCVCVSPSWVAHLYLSTSPTGLWMQLLRPQSHRPREQLASIQQPLLAEEKSEQL